MRGYDLFYRMVMVVLLLALGLLAYGFAVWAWQSPVELGAYDMVLRMRPVHAPRGDLVVLAIDDRTARAFGNPPWTRAVHARIVNALNRAGAKYIVYDVFFRAHDTAHPNGDRLMWQAMMLKRNVLLPMIYDAGRPPSWNPADIRGLIALERFALTQNISYPAGAAMYRYYFLIPPWADFVSAARGLGVAAGDMDTSTPARQVRLAHLSQVKYPVPDRVLPRTLRTPTLIDQTVVVQGLPLAAARTVFGVEDKALVRTSIGGDITLIANLDPPVSIPIDNAGRMYVNYAGPTGTYTYLSAIDLLQNRLDARLLAGKTVIVGQTYAGARSDLVNTPYGPMPRAEVTANSLGTILDRSYIGRSQSTALLALMLVALLVGLVLPAIDRNRIGGWALGLALGYIVVCVISLSALHQALPVIPGTILIFTGALFAGLLKRSELTEDHRSGTLASDATDTAA